MNCLECALIARTQTSKTTIHLREKCNNNYLWPLVSRRERQIFNHQKYHMEQKLDSHFETFSIVMKQTRDEAKKFACMKKQQIFPKLTNLSASHLP